MEKNFLARLIEGSISATAIDDEIEKWHTGDYTDKLHTFLGMTWEEYALWAQDPKALDRIVENRKRCLTSGVADQLSLSP